MCAGSHALLTVYACACGRQGSVTDGAAQGLQVWRGGGCMGSDLGPRERWRLAHKVLADGQAPGVRRVCLGGADDPAGALRSATSLPHRWEAVQLLVRAWVSRPGPAQIIPSSVARRSVTYRTHAVPPALTHMQAARGRRGHRRQRQSHLRVRQGRRHARRGRELRLSAEAAVARRPAHSAITAHSAGRGLQAQTQADLVMRSCGLAALVRITAGAQQGETDAVMRSCTLAALVRTTAGAGQGERTAPPLSPRAPPACRASPPAG